MEKHEITAQSVLEFMDNSYVNNGSVHDTIQLAIALTPKCGARPSKPYLSHNHKSEEAIKYANALKEYEANVAEYRKTEQEIDVIRNYIYEAIVKFIKSESGFNDHVPVKYMDKVYNLAYENGHSNGYYSVYQELESLVKIFS